MPYWSVLWFSLFPPGEPINHPRFDRVLRTVLTQNLLCQATWESTAVEALLPCQRASAWGHVSRICWSWFVDIDLISRWIRHFQKGFPLWRSTMSGIPRENQTHFFSNLPFWIVLWDVRSLNFTSGSQTWQWIFHHSMTFPARNLHSVWELPN